MSDTRKKIILVCTPVDEIHGVLNRLHDKFSVIYLPNASLEDIHSLDTHNIWGIFTNPNRSKVYFGAEVFNLLPNLKVICTASTGIVHIDSTLADLKNISILSLKNETDFLMKVTSTADLAFTLMLNMIRKITPASIDVLNGGWDCEKFIGRQVCDLNIGILGFGRLGKIFANHLSGFNSQVSFFDPYVEFATNQAKIVKIKNLKEFLQSLDVLSIHIHATDKNIKYINKEFLSFCKKNIVIINTSRGEIIDEADMVNFLKNNPGSSYATDVISDEIKNLHSSPILSYFKEVHPSNSIIVTPHIGGMSEGSRNLAYNKALDLLEDFIYE